MYTIIQGIRMAQAPHIVLCPLESLMSLGACQAPALAQSFLVSWPRLSLSGQEAPPGFAMALQTQAVCRIRHSLDPLAKQLRAAC